MDIMELFPMLLLTIVALKNNVEWAEIFIALLSSVIGIGVSNFLLKLLGTI